VLLYHHEQRLQEMDIQIIADPGSGKDFGAVQKGDVVILPAFGASVQEMQLLNDKEAIMVDTTCPWVSKVSITSNRCLHPGPARCLNI
jgi:4-hydroxy-3-methylbut-2-en-1-yl diphosphate reductase